MIIELAPSFGNFAEENWRPYHRALENLINAHGEGWHLFAPSREASQSILQFCSLSKTQDQIFKYHIANRVSVASGQARSADMVIIANPDNDPNKTYRSNQIGVPLNFFSFLNACAPARLITENSATDGKLLEMLSEIMARDLKHNSPLSFDHIHGGGGTTALCLQTACKSPRPTLCILDSDRKFPGAPLGETARQVAALDISNFHETVKTYVLPVREIENILPISLMLDVYINSPEVRGRVSPLLRYIERRIAEGITPEANALDYIDFKFGLKRSDVAKLPVEQRAMFRRFAEIARPSETKQPEYTDTTDNTFIIDGISEYLTPQFIEFINKSSHKKNEIANKIRKSPAWIWMEQLIRLVLAFGTASPRLPIRG